MRFNTDPSFVGVPALIEQHRKQIADFESWAANRQWMQFHLNHYDWWAFPISFRSSYGKRYTVYEGEIHAMNQQSEFVVRHRRGIELLALSWGWDVHHSDFIEHPDTDQAWQHWTVRLYKAAWSAQLFSHMDLFESLKTYALWLMKRGEDFSYGGHDLSWLFTGGNPPTG